jgi:ABC-type multidrug transport system permease subunit
MEEHFFLTQREYIRGIQKSRRLLKKKQVYCSSHFNGMQRVGLLHYRYAMRRHNFIFKRSTENTTRNLIWSEDQVRPVRLKFIWKTAWSVCYSWCVHVRMNQFRMFQKRISELETIVLGIFSSYFWAALPVFIWFLCFVWSVFLRLSESSRFVIFSLRSTSLNITRRLRIYRRTRIHRPIYSCLRQDLL